MSKVSQFRFGRWVGAAAVAVAIAAPAAATAAPAVLAPNLSVRTAASGLMAPISMAFIAPNDMLVLEKNTGRVQRVVNGSILATVLDLPVNFASERGLLGIALDPDFPIDPGVYLFWSESASGTDSASTTDVPVLGNRIDRFEWNGLTLTFDRTLIRLRSLQVDAGQPARGNHDGGVLRFGPDGKLYAVVGDTGRRGQLQNLANGPFGPGIPDDQFGGPEPRDAHLTGVVLRLNEDGTAPPDNPFYAAGAAIGGEAGANIQKVFAYGIRNSFGIAFDPATGALWDEQNGDDSFTEINLVEPGANLGWVQVMGPISRVAEFKAIETDTTPNQPFTPAGYFGLQQVRWPPTNIADTPAEARSRLFMLPGAHYSDPEFSWRFEVAPAGIGFLESRALGRQYEGDLFVGAARTFLADGQLWRLEVAGNGRKIAVDDPRLEDRVADNAHKYDVTESETLLFGTGFGVGTDIQTGPNGNLFVVSLDQGVIHEIHARK